MNTITFGRVIDPTVESVGQYGNVFKFCLYSKSSGACEFAVWEEMTDTKTGARKLNPLFTKCKSILKDGVDVVLIVSFYVNKSGKLACSLKDIRVDDIQLKAKVNGFFSGSAK